MEVAPRGFDASFATAVLQRIEGETEQVLLLVLHGLNRAHGHAQARGYPGEIAFVRRTGGNSDIWVADADGKNARWTKIGAAWQNRDGKGFSLNCGAMPLHGRMVMRAYEPRADYDPR